MIWPTIVIDNFFNNPKAVIEFANNLEFQK
jgi:hypothetical protein